MQNAADEKEVKDLSKKAENERLQELDDIKALLKLPAGIRFFKRLMKEGKMFNTTFTGNSYSYFLEGHRNLALRFFSDIAEVAPDKVSELMIKKGDKYHD